MFMLVLMAMVISHLDMIKEETTKVTDMQEAIAELYSEMSGDEGTQISLIQEDVHHFLSLLETSESEKWKLYTLYQKPLEYYRNLVDLIELNIPLYQELYHKEEVCEFVEKQISFIENSHDRTVFTSLAPEQTIYPTLIHPIVQIAIDSKFYYGLLTAQVFQSDDFTETIDDMILVKLKALADKSKLQILLSLKKKPKYNLELAEELQLSAGTISHHMNALLATNLVKVQKDSGKVYYYLDKDEIQSFTSKLNSILFD